MSHEKPYAGLRVVDLSQGIAGPYCAMLLAQYGADVIKVEPPEGDWARVLGPRYGSHTAFSVIGNLGKRGIVLDLKQEGDKETLRRLLRTADVFMEGFRPGVAARLGFDFETVKALAPGIIYVSVSGFGQTGPLSAKPAMDPVLQAFTGFTHENKGHDGIPHRASPDHRGHVHRALHAPGGGGRGLCPARGPPGALHRFQPDGGGRQPPGGQDVRDRDGRRADGHSDLAFRRVPDGRRLAASRRPEGQRLPGALRPDRPARTLRRTRASPARRGALPVWTSSMRRSASISRRNPPHTGRPA